LNLPVAETSCRIVRLAAFSVVTGIGFSRLLAMTAPTIAKQNQRANPDEM
jgi:hypothetical protein